MDTTSPYSVDLLSGGPGAPPQPWVVNGATIRYDGCVMVPSNVVNGDTGLGTINTNALYVKGVQFVNPVGNYLPLTGGALSGQLVILNPSYLQMGGGSPGQNLVTNGSGGLSWSSAPPGGPYLQLAGGALSGPLQIAGPSGLVMGGGAPGNVLSTNGLGVLSWIPMTGGGGGGSIVVGDTPPVSPTIGTLWWDSVGGQLYIWYNDGNTSQWVISINGGLFTAGYLPLNGGTLTGPLTLASDPSVPLGAVTKQYSDTKLPLSGGTLTGPLVLAADPVAPLQPTTKQYVDALPVAMNDNRIINGDMRIDQRNGGASGTAGGYTIDRWVNGVSVVGKITWGRNLNSVGAAQGFPYYLGFQSTSAYTVPAGEIYALTQYIEADMISDFWFGTANAQPVTLSFWVQSSKTGTFSGAISNYASTRSYPFIFSIPTANTWTKIAITIPGDTGGTWQLAGNAGCAFVSFDLGSGATYRGPAGAWASSGYYGATGSQSIVNTNAATFYVTGVKLEIGSVATPFNRQSLTKSLADCQRYYQAFGINLLMGAYAQNAGYQFQGILYSLPVTMRALPTIVGGVFNNGNNISAGSASLISLNSFIMVQFTAAAIGGFYATPTFTGLNAEL
jgi:hypothetical protein